MGQAICGEKISFSYNGLIQNTHNQIYMPSFHLADISLEIVLLEKIWMRP